MDRLLSATNDFPSDHYVILKFVHMVLLPYRPGAPPLPMGPIWFLCSAIGKGCRMTLNAFGYVTGPWNASMRRKARAYRFPHIADFHLAHFGGNKERLHHSSNGEAYENAIHTHWWFLIITTPIIIVSITFTF